MGYACPVCGAEQVDGVHLANHLAITASLGRSDHEAWLAEYAPDWNENSPAELADRVVPHAPEIDTPEFETDDGARPATGFERELAAQSRGPGRGSRTAGGHGVGPNPLGRAEGRSDDVEAVIAEARDLTEQRRAETDEGKAQETPEQGEAQDRTGGDDGADATGDDEAADDAGNESATDPDENA